jgi:hypothetical protein
MGAFPISASGLSTPVRRKLEKYRCFIELQEKKHGELFDLSTVSGGQMARELCDFIAGLHLESAQAAAPVPPSMPAPDLTAPAEEPRSRGGAADWDGLCHLLQAIPDRHDGVPLRLIPHDTSIDRFLDRNGLETVGQLKNFDFRESNKGLGREKYADLVAMAQRILDGELDVAMSGEIEAARAVAGIIDRFMQTPADEEYNQILRLRLMGESESDEPWTLERVGERFGKTRERVRQIGEMQTAKLLNQGGMRLQRALECIAAACEEKCVPLTTALFREWLGNAACACAVRLYLALVDVLAPPDLLLPIWTDPPSWRGGDNEQIRRVAEALKELQHDEREPMSVAAAYYLLKKDLDAVTRTMIFIALAGNETFVVDPVRWTFTRKPARLNLTVGVQKVLQNSSRAMTLQEIEEAGRLRFGDNWPGWEPRSVANSLRPEDGFYRLGSGLFGLDRHVELTLNDRAILVGQFHEYLEKLDKPAPAGLFIRTHAEWAGKASAYILAALVHQDPRFMQVGRKFLFGLKAWGRTHVPEIADLILDFVDEPCDFKEIFAEVNRHRETDVSAVKNALDILVDEGNLVIENDNYRGRGP